MMVQRGIKFIENYESDMFYNETGSTKTFYLNGATDVHNASDNSSITISFTISAYSSRIIYGYDLNLISE